MHQPTMPPPPAMPDPPAEPAAAAASPVRRLREAIAASRSDISIVAAITLLAALLRLWRLDTMPLGLHGDEAWTALDAQRIVREGWIGPYVLSALGQPTGPLYFTALIFKILPDTTFAARLSMALLGVATIPFAYLAFAAMFNRTVAAFASLLLAVMMWHLHLSRTAFMVTAWPLMEVLALWVLWLALRRRAVWLFAIAGAVHGLGLYSYNAYLLFVPVPCVALLWATFYEHGWRARARFVALPCGAFAVCVLIVALPLLHYIDGHPRDYSEHQRLVGVTYSPEWKDAGTFGKAKLIGSRAREWELGLVRGGRDDFGDGLATPGHPAIDPIVSLLAAAGLIVALWNWRKPQYAVILSSLVLLPWGALLTISDGLFRRTLGLAPFVALLAALPLAWLWERCWRARDGQRRLYLAATLAVVGFVGVRTTVQYFGPVQDTVAMRYVFPYQLDATSRWLNTLPDGTYVYLYSDRWSIDYETRLFLAPNITGEDRSVEFRPESLGTPDETPIDYRPDRRRDVVFVFLGDYENSVREAVAVNPGGSLTEVRRGDDVLFRGYYLPRLPGESIAPP